jgi:hypothetical protein
MQPPFVDDDEGYRAWVAQHPDGFVLNTDRTPSPSNLVLHKATCTHITRLRPPLSWTETASKVCALSAAELEQWARTTVGGTVRRCRSCTP